MAGSDPVGNIFDDIDENRDGKIDKKELGSWIAGRTRMTSPSRETHSYAHDQKDNGSRYERYRYQETITGSNSSNNENLITTNSSEETKRYLERAGINVFIDPNPKIVRRQTTERPVTFEQRVFIRCLQPPALPPPEPIIIKEVRPEQPPPPPPLIIREQSSLATSPPPIILRERPPTPPARPKSQTTTRYLPPIPLPPRSLVIERLPPAPDKPRDIVIERWLPYGPQSEARTIVQPAPPPIPYPAPTHTIIEYDGLQSNIVRKFERLGVTQEDPDSYLSRHRGSLLDSSTLIQQARKLGITEDISCPTRLATMGAIVNEKIGESDHLSSGGYSYEKIQRTSAADSSDLKGNSYSLSTSVCIDDGNHSTQTRERRSGYRLADGSQQSHM